MRKETLAEMFQEEHRRIKESQQRGEKVWWPEQLKDITERAKTESLDAIARQYHCSVADVERGLLEAKGEK